MNSKIKPCKTCARLGQYQNGASGCVKFKIEVNPATDFCSWHITSGQTTQCELCHSNINNKDIILWISQDGNKTIACCQECVNKMGMCATCYYNNQCGFINDHSEPQYVNRTIQKGFMTMQTQIKNPHLVDKHCATCRCSYQINGEYQCQKEDNNLYCHNWIMK